MRFVALYILLLQLPECSGCPLTRVLTYLYTWYMDAVDRLANTFIKLKSKLEQA